MAMSIPRFSGRKPCTNPETDEVYEAGSEWQVDDCKSCACKTNDAGQLVETCKNSCEEPPPDPDECATVRCADPDCEYGYPVKIDGECCPVCPPEECAMVDCMPVHPNCESVYTRDSLCCPVCKTSLFLLNVFNIFFLNLDSDT